MKMLEKQMYKPSFRPEPAEEPVVEAKSTYRNPVIDYSLPDPTIIKSDDGYFYLYATEDIRNTPIHRSRNLVDWEEIGTAFTEETRPTFEPKEAYGHRISIMLTGNMYCIIPCPSGEVSGPVGSELLHPTNRKGRSLTRDRCSEARQFKFKIL